MSDLYLSCYFLLTACLFVYVQSNCSLQGQVCGHDGHTYSSQCAAWAARVTVDYLGACRAFGNLTGMRSSLHFVTFIYYLTFLLTLHSYLKFLYIDSDKVEVCSLVLLSLSI